MSPQVRRLARSLLVPLMLLAGGVLLARATGFDANRVRELLDTLGFWSGPAFIGLFVVGTLINLPGMAFLVAARLLFGATVGFALSYVGAVAGVTAGFAFARFVMPRMEPKPPRYAWVRRALEQVEERPIRTVALLRLVMLASPALHYALALTPIRNRDHMAGSALGLAIPVAVVVGAAGLLF